jgi:hypothetical protein
MILVLAAIAFLGFSLVREARRPDFFSRPSVGFLGSFVAPYRLRTHPVFGDKGPVVLTVVGFCLGAIGLIGLVAIILRSR